MGRLDLAEEFRKLRMCSFQVRVMEVTSENSMEGTASASCSGTRVALGGLGRFISGRTVELKQGRARTECKAFPSRLSSLFSYISSLSFDYLDLLILI